MPTNPRFTEPTSGSRRRPSSCSPSSSSRTATATTARTSPARGSRKSMSGTETLTLAAIGDLHVTEASEHRYRDMFEEISEVADVLALCGDLTNFGKTREAEILAEDLRHCTIPSVAVLGNHDYECGQPEEVARILHAAGVTVLGEQAVVIKDVGFAGVKGFLGGFGRGELGAFGEAPIKAFGDAVLGGARKGERRLRALKTERNVAVMHYSPIAGTLEGEPLEIYPFLGCSRLADA